ncbi:MAG: hypothetical protein GXO36_06960, partial [Chloroflexi bacterium]|nr:hypothetical protein [Chloroflexota bacterium]
APVVDPQALGLTATAIVLQVTQQAGGGTTTGTTIQGQLPSSGLADGVLTSPLGLSVLAVMLVAVLLVARQARRRME